MSGDSLIWIDGSDSSTLPLPDRGLDYGDGVFETLLLRRSQPLHLQRHLSRLLHGCDALSFPPVAEQVQQHLASATAQLQTRAWPWAALRITVTRGSGPRGYAPPAAAQPRCIITATKLDNDPLQKLAPARLCIARSRWPTQTALAGVKHLNRLPQVLAAGEYQLKACDEAVMLDESDHVISVTAGNLYALIDGDVLTPELHCAGVRGTRRDLLIDDWAPSLGYSVKEARLTIRQLEQAEELFYSNSLIGLRPVRSLEDRLWSQHGVCSALHDRYLEGLR